ncbi:hypothetical protein, partial [Pseudoalteromonas sp.]|uniref:hypothetical protein n=1 Tax=Pseudoalteromonas sp. TaxID=53249 RepID=UPI0035628DD2
NDLLRNSYKRILSTICKNEFSFKEDKYSGIFLTYPFKAYDTTKIKVMIVGRETAGWNSKNEKNTFNRIIKKSESNQLDTIIDESLLRYSWHLKDSIDGEIKSKHSSHFKRFFTTVAKQIEIEPEAIVYANLLAWDYDGLSPLQRPAQEQDKIVVLSIQLLAEQISFYKPDHIVFATGVHKVDKIIKRLFNEYFDGYKTLEVEPRKLWQFKAADATCYRIAHPRAMANDHPKFRQKVIELIKNNAAQIS